MKRSQELIAKAANLILQGCLQEAQEALEEAVSIARDDDDEATARDATSTLAGVFKRMGRFDDALTSIREVHESAVLDEDTESQQTSLANEATLLWEMSMLNGDHHELEMAWDRAELSRVLCEENDWDERLVFVLGTCGLIARFQDKWEVARACFERQLKLARKVGNPDDYGRALLNYISFNLETNKYEYANKLANELHGIIDQIRDPETRNNATKLLRQLGLYES